MHLRAGPFLPRAVLATDHRYLTNSLGKGMSPAAPNCWMMVPEVEPWAKRAEMTGFESPRLSRTCFGPSLETLSCDWTEEAAVEGDYLDLISGQEDDVFGVVVAGGAEFDAGPDAIIFAENGTLFIQNSDDRIAVADALAEFDEDDVVFVNIGIGHQVVFD